MSPRRRSIVGVNHPPIADLTKRKFKLLMDAHVPRKLSRFLRNDGHDVVEIVDVNTHLPDTKIVKLSIEEKRIIVTADSDFGCLIFKHEFDPHGVIYIKFHPLSRKKCRLVFDRISELLDSVESLDGKIATITMGKIRVTGYDEVKKHEHR